VFTLIRLLIANRTQPLEVRFSWQGDERIICPAIIANSEETILVDCGYAGFMPLIEDEMKGKGFAFRDVSGRAVFLLKMTSPGRERKRLFSCVITGRKELLP
jgi:hypothetical protein